MNFYISFGGPLTFKNARVPKEVLAQVPLDRILIETDAPYLAPQSKRGKSNEPAFLPETAITIALAKGISLGELAQATKENATHFFSFDTAV